MRYAKQRTARSTELQSTAQQYRYTLIYAEHVGHKINFFFLGGGGGGLLHAPNICFMRFRIKTWNEKYTINVSTTIVTTRHKCKLKHRSTWLPEEDKQIWPKHVADHTTNKKGYCATSWIICEYKIAAGKMYCTLCCTINERWIFSKSQTGGDVGVQLPS
jgi:hypothetical protein